MAGSGRETGWAEASEDEAFHVDVEGFEGPLDLLLHLARRDKVDLSRISILALAEQYVAFVAEARGLRMELAADYLVMAAWLAYLKSRLLLPKPSEEEGEDGDELAAALRFRLQRLDAMREAGIKLMARRQLGRDVFPRGLAESDEAPPARRYSASLHDLLAAYASQRQRSAVTEVRIAKRNVWALAEARELLVRLLGREGDWTALDRFLILFACPPSERRSALASSFAASLELVREGRLEARQAEAFAPLYLRPAEPLRPKLKLVR
ncbi:MAG: segregation/condensation protein A [Mesorhizobium amorphae]|nr:MAG: segregation/condensation protein A [Mesorhizobium amorphae]